MMRSLLFACLIACTLAFGGLKPRKEFYQPPSDAEKLAEFDELAGPPSLPQQPRKPTFSPPHTPESIIGDIEKAKSAYLVAMDQIKGAAEPVRAAAAANTGVTREHSASTNHPPLDVSLDPTVDAEAWKGFTDIHQLAATIFSKMSEEGIAEKTVVGHFRELLSTHVKPLKDSRTVPDCASSAAWIQIMSPLLSFVTSLAIVETFVSQAPSIAMLNWAQNQTDTLTNVFLSETLLPRSLTSTVALPALCSPVDCHVAAYRMLTQDTAGSPGQIPSALDQPHTIAAMMQARQSDLAGMTHVLVHSLAAGAVAEICTSTDFDAGALSSISKNEGATRDPAVNSDQFRTVMDSAVRIATYVLDQFPKNEEAWCVIQSRPNCQSDGTCDMPSPSDTSPADIAGKDEVIDLFGDDVGLNVMARLGRLQGLGYQLQNAVLTSRLDPRKQIKVLMDIALDLEQSEQSPTIVELPSIDDESLDTDLRQQLLHIVKGHSRSQ